MRTLSWFLVVLVAVLASPPSLADAGRSLAFVQGSVARLREAPEKDAPVVVTLRIGEPVRVLSRKGGWAKVEALVDGVPRQPARGWLKRGLLTKERPTLERLLARFEKASNVRGKRRYIERATALVPWDEGVIEKLIATLGEAKDARFHHMAKKGLVAAKKRNASWDGPLYPTVDAVTSIPRACFEGDPSLAGSGREALSTKALSTKALSTKALRARAFEIVDSGKVVSVTTLGYQTQLLDRRVCLEGPCGKQLGYVLPRKATSGALVPSWMVAGHLVTGYETASASEVARALGADKDSALAEACEGCRLYLDASGRSAVQLDAGGRFRLALRTFEGVRVSAWQTGEAPYGSARPIARFDEQRGQWRLLWLAEAGREACPGERTAWLVRLRFADDDALVGVEEGRRFTSGYAP